MSNISQIPDEHMRLITSFIENQLRQVVEQQNVSASANDANAAPTHKLVLRGFEVRRPTRSEYRKANRANGKQLLKQSKQQMPQKQVCDPSDEAPQATTNAASDDTLPPTSPEITVAAASV